MTGRLLVFSLMVIGMATSASAQVTYRRGVAGVHGAPQTQPQGADDDVSHETHPSYQIFGTSDGPAVRVIERCAYPDGWNVTDYSRELNGVPAGYDHTCPATNSAGQGVRARY